MKKKKKTITTIIVMLLLAIGIVAAYFVISERRSREREERELEVTEVDKLLERNMETAYPATPRETVKLYSRMMRCFYNEEMTDAEVEQMMDKMRLLFDEEFLTENPREKQLEKLWEEIKDYKSHERTVISYQIEKAEDMISWTMEGEEYARLIASYTQQEERNYAKVYEEFILRKNADGRWKILGWRLADSEDMER